MKLTQLSRLISRSEVLHSLIGQLKLSVAIVGVQLDYLFTLGPNSLIISFSSAARINFSS